METKKHLSQRSRNFISFAACFIAILIMYADYRIENVSSTIIQWGIFLIAVVIVLNFQLFYNARNHESDIESFDAKNNKQNDNGESFMLEDDKNPPLKSLLKIFDNFKDEKNEDKKTISQSQGGKNVLIVQPMIVVSDSEFNAKINKFSELEQAPEPKLAELDSPPQEEMPVRSYSIQGVPDKYRAMCDDIHSFAINSHVIHNNPITLEQLKNKLPDYAKDIKLNLASVLTEEGAGDLSQKQIYHIALAVAYTSKNFHVIESIFDEASKILSAADIHAAKAAATIMAMNNIYYRFVHLISDKSFSSLPAKLRMNVIGNPGIDKIDFELNCLAVSAINGCGMCIDAHTNELIKAGVSKLGIQSVVRIASVLNAVSTGIEISLNASVMQQEMAN